jgi:hypothetical protein
MQMLTILELIGIFAAYFGVTLLLPCLLLRQKVKHLRFSIRFLIYLITGNFYIMNLVFLLELLHISHTVTLILFTIIPYLIVYVRLYRVNLKAGALLQLEQIQRLSGGQLGYRTFLNNCFKGIGAKLKHICRSGLRKIWNNLLDVILVLGLTALLFWSYGSNVLFNYGYCASDIPVHNYWINYLGQNQIFVAGVYPFGFHCVLYYLHAVFQFDTYVLLRLFCVVQTWLVHMVLLAFIRTCCKSKYAAYAGIAIYAASTLFHPDTFSRYFSSLPQEFGMVFILPSIYFALAFFQEKHSELVKQQLKKLEYQQDFWLVSLQKDDPKGKHKKRKKKENSDWCLILFALSFSLTLAVHFYDTMIAGLFCLGIGVAYFYRFFRWEYFWRIIAAGMIGIAIAVLPMGIAFATGTPLQGSLGWGMNVIAGTNNTDASANQGNNAGTQGAAPAPVTDNATNQPDGTNPVSPKNQQSVDAQNDVILLSDTFVQKANVYLGKAEIFAREIYTKVDQAVMDHVTYKTDYLFSIAILGTIGILLILGLLFYLLRQLDYASHLMAAGVYMVLMAFLQSARMLGVPEMMDASRTSIFFAYSLPIVWGLCLDGVVYILFGWTKRKWILNQAALIGMIFVAGLFVWKGKVKDVGRLESLESNAAVTCLTNIIRDNKDDTWTICSANDELRMGEDHGYHYEVIDFLQLMNYTGNKGFVQIPTHEVYFFIEKKPIDYLQKYSKSGQYVSEEGAKAVLPSSDGISVYMGENRWNVMSHMYYWAKAFQQMYPNEMKVYYETDDFICYRIEQNDFSLYNFSIDYGYNMQ